MSMVRGNSFSSFGVPAAIFKEEYEPQKPYLGNDLDSVKAFLDRVHARHPEYFQGYRDQSTSG